MVHAHAAGAAWASLTPLASCATRERTEGAGAPDADLPREFRSVWVATVDNIDWPSEPGLPARTQRDEIARIVESCARTGLNAILLQVRPTSDALYRSRLEPWSAFLTGRQGQAPVPTYDPLEVWLEAAHDAGLDVHAWVNPFRVRHPKSIGRDAPLHIANKRPDLVRAHGPYLWLDPGEPEDLLDRYDIDGVHMDDYFYPYPQKDKPFPDAESFRRHADAHGRGLSIDDWRRENINTFIRDTGTLVRTSRPGSLFTVSPFGIWRPENPPGIKGFDAYAGLYADSRRWLGEGWVDALMPQLYWPVDSPGQPFEPLLDWWRAQNTRGRHLWPGLYLTRIKPAGAEGASWEPEEIERQIRIIRDKPDADGWALFSMVGLLENRRGVTDRVRTMLHEPAFVPASPWSGARSPATASVRTTARDHALHPTPGRGGAPVRRWAVRYATGAGVRTLSVPGIDRRIVLPSGVREATVVPVGPNGATGPAARARF